MTQEESENRKVELIIKYLEVIGAHEFIECGSSQEKAIQKLESLLKLVKPPAQVVFENYAGTSLSAQEFIEVHSSRDLEQYMHKCETIILQATDQAIHYTQELDKAKTMLSDIQQVFGINDLVNSDFQEVVFDYTMRQGTKEDGDGCI